MRILACFMAFALLALPVWASGAGNPSRRVTAESSGAYTLDKSHASIVFSIKHLGFSDYIGRINEFDAQLNLDGNNPANSRLSVTINPASADTNNAELESKLDGENYFNVAKFPEITFISTEVKPTSRTRGTVTGDLTMLGITRPVTLDVTLNGVGLNSYANAYTVGFSATGTLRRSDWGMKTLVPQVSDEVRLIISAEFNRKPQASEATPPAPPQAAR